MAEAHAHNHSHHHNHGAITELQHVKNAFYVGIALNFLFVLIEVTAGFIIHSLSLLSDAGHNLLDVVSLALSLLAFRLVKVEANENYTYGYRKTTILVALFNGIVLMISIGAIGYEAIKDLFNPKQLPGFTIAWIAAVGIIINGITAFLFMKDKEKDMNIKAAYLHLLSDALVSFALVIGGIIMHYTNWFWIDAILSFVVAVVIIRSTWSLLKGSLRLSLDGVPENVDMNKIQQVISDISGVENIHHVHVWGISTTTNALTAHVLVKDNISISEADKLKAEIKHELEHLNIHHATLEFEYSMKDCAKEKI